MIADINITEKSFGPNTLMTGVKFSVSDKEKVGLIGRNGIGKTTLFGLLTGADKDFSGDIVYRKGISVVATAQEHHIDDRQTVLQYILTGLPEYASLSHIIETFPAIMGDDMKKIARYSEALQRFDDKGFYRIEEKVVRELDNLQLPDIAHRPFSSLSGGQKRLVEVVKVMHSDAQLALIDEPTNHMDYVAKAQFIDWLKSADEAMLIITHDRDVLREVDRIVELKDATAQSYKGNYDDYLKQNATSTSSRMNEYEVTQRQIDNLKKRVQYARSKKASWGGTADKRNPFVVMEQKALREIRELEKISKPSFWIDKASAAELDFRSAERYRKYKAKNIRMNLRSDESRSKHVLVKAVDVSLGYNEPLFTGVNIDLREGEALELRGRNGAGKTTLIKALLGHDHAVNIFAGELTLDAHVRVGVYEQEVSSRYFELSLHEAIERVYLDRNLPVSETKVRQLMGDYLFTDSDLNTPVAKLSGGQKARLQIIQMLASDPQLLILDEPTNHLDLPSIEELETALGKYTGAILYVSHDGYFRQALGGATVQVGSDS
ncbi:MAG TPA: ABC-F family ATP-binding cassette domain-containing protein [Candidatus Saccharimonadales bacterium]|nr:ABC-F family ATP-binding cassette domain-containing protein [Candidatus Saccharimonadales bacterium]